MMKKIILVAFVAILTGCTSTTEIQKIKLEKNMTLLTTQEVVKLFKGNSLYYDNDTVTYYDPNGKYYNYYTKREEADGGIWFVEDNKLYTDVPQFKNMKYLIRVVKEGNSYIEYDDNDNAKIIKIKKGDVLNILTDFDWD